MQRSPGQLWQQAVGPERRHREGGLGAISPGRQSQGAGGPQDHLRRGWQGLAEATAEESWKWTWVRRETHPLAVGSRCVFLIKWCTLQPTLSGGGTFSEGSHRAQPPAAGMGGSHAGHGADSSGQHL